MSLSVYSFINAIIFFNIGIVAIKILRKNTKFLVENSTKALLLLVMLSFLRLVFPIDFKNTIVISSYKIIPAIISGLNTEVVLNLSLGVILLIIWLTGAICILIKEIFVIIKEREEIKKSIFVRNERIQYIAKEIFNGEILVCINSTIKSPKVTGRKTAYLFLPEIEFSNEELKYILLHELQHIKGNDTSIKILYILIKSLFWWNPIVFSFQREVENLLELRCDARVIKNITEDERVIYLESILRIIKRIGLDSQDYSPSMSSLVNAKEDTFIKQRFEIVLNKSEGFKKNTAIATVIVMVALFIASYFIILQPAYLPPEIEGEMIIDQQTSEIRVDEGGVLSLYYKDEFQHTLEKEELDYLPYSELEIVEEEY